MQRDRVDDDDDDYVVHVFECIFAAFRRVVSYTYHTYATEEIIAKTTKIAFAFRQVEKCFFNFLFFITYFIKYTCTTRYGMEEIIMKKIVSST